jgi:hypothetical protein
MPASRKVQLRRESKQGRKAARAKLGKLKSNLVSQKIQVKYALHFNSFIEFCNAHGGVPRSHMAMDGMCQKYIEELWEEGEAKSKAAYSLAAIQHFLPYVKHHLSGAWRLVTAWEKLEMPNRCIPLCPQVVFAIAGLLQQWQQPQMGLAVALCFGLLLRTGELFQIRAHWCHFSAGSRECVVRFYHSKGLQLGNKKTEEVVLREKVTLKVLAQLCENKLPGEPLVDFTAAQFRKYFGQAIKHLGLLGKYQPYSLRRGGATEYFRRSGRFDLCMELGRWQNLKTCRMYVQDAMATTARISYSPQQNAMFQTLGQPFLQALQKHG